MDESYVYDEIEAVESQGTIANDWPYMGLPALSGSVCRAIRNTRFGAAVSRREVYTWRALYDPIMSETEYLEVVRRNIRKQSALDCRSILPFEGYQIKESHPRTVYIISGHPFVLVPLREYLQAASPDTFVKLCLIADIAEAVSYLHSKSPRILGADLSLDNIFVDSNLTGLLRYGEGNPTLRYCSLELVDDANNHTAPSDVWRWACMSYEIITDDVPYHWVGNRSAAIIKNILAGIKPGRLNASTVPLPLVELLGRCWETAPNMRPTIDECLEGIMQILCGRE